MDLATAITLSGGIAAVGVTLNSIDLWSPSPAFAAFFDWRVMGAAYATRTNHRHFAATVTVAGRQGALRLGALTQALFSWSFVVASLLGSQGLQFLFASMVLLALCHLHFRLVVGLDGSDQMQVILWVALALASIGRETPIATAGLAFLVAQVVLSYLVSGVAKLASPIWRSGEAVPAILSTREYGVNPVRKLLRLRGVGLLASWLVIAFEIAGPFLLLGGAHGAWLFLCAGLIFHLANWIVMGLRSFVFAFVGTYPLLFFVVQDLW